MTVARTAPDMTHESQVDEGADLLSERTATEEKKLKGVRVCTVSLYMPCKLEQLASPTLPFHKVL